MTGTAGDGQSLRDYIDQQLRERLERRLAEEPWVCILCGAAGNGAETWTSWEPGTYWFPPEDHVCTPKPSPDLQGILAD